MSALAGIVALDYSCLSDSHELEVMLRAMVPTGIDSRIEAFASPTGRVRLGRTIYGPDSGERAHSEGGDQMAIMVGKLCSRPGKFASDTEYILREYHDAPVLGFAFDGTFAAAIADLKNDAVTLVTDHLCSCPLFICQHSGLAYFASEVKGIVAVERIPCRVDVASMLSMLASSQLFNLRTLVEGISRLDRATICRIHNGQINRQPYWRFEIQDNPRDRGLNDHAEQLRSTLHTALSRYERDGQTALLLSGGLDSRTMVAFLSNPQDVTAISYSAHDTDITSGDVAVARAIAGKTGMPFHVARYSGQTVLEAIRDSVVDSDGAAGFAHPVPGSVWDALRNNLNCSQLLVGDECFGRAGGPVRQTDVLDFLMIRTLSQCSSILPYLRADRLKDFSALVELELACLMRGRDGRPAHNLIDELWLYQGIGQLFSAMRRNLSRHGILVHRPLLDRPVLELVAATPARHRIGKQFERRALALQNRALYHLPFARYSESIDYHVYFAALEQERRQVSTFIFRDTPQMENFFDVKRIAELIKIVGRTPPSSSSRGPLMSLSASLPTGWKLWLAAHARYYLHLKSPFITGSSAILQRLLVVAAILGHVGRRCRP